MDTGGKLSAVTECMEILSDRLLELSNLIDTIHLGLMAENAEKQSLDCLMCIRHLVNDLHGIAENSLMRLKKEAEQNG